MSKEEIKDMCWKKWQRKVIRDDYVKSETNETKLNIVRKKRRKKVGVRI